MFFFSWWNAWRLSWLADRNNVLQQSISIWIFFNLACIVKYIYQRNAIDRPIRILYSHTRPLECRAQWATRVNKPCIHLAYIARPSVSSSYFVLIHSSHSSPLYIWNGLRDIHFSWVHIRSFPSSKMAFYYSFCFFPMIFRESLNNINSFKEKCDFAYKCSLLPPPLSRMTQVKKGQMSPWEFGSFSFSEKKKTKNKRFFFCILVRQCVA